MLNTALKIAIANDVEGLPRMGAVLSYRKQIKAVGWNRRRSHPMQKKFASIPERILLHAEIDCIKNALKQFPKDEIGKFTLYIARVHKDGTPALAAPCEGCLEAIKEYGIKKVIWTE